MATKATHTHFTSDKKVTHTQTLLHSKAGVAGRIGLRAVGVVGCTNFPNTCFTLARPSTPTGSVFYARIPLVVSK